MKYFLSTLGSPPSGLILGIPCEAAAFLRYLPGKPGGPVEEDEEEQRFSLPHFFGFSGEEIRHGIILKGGVKPRVLLLTAVEREEEFAAGELHSPPPLLGALGGFLTGLRFQALEAGDSLPLLLIDPFKLTEEILRRRTELV
ncbi:MAG: hypothetical protein LBQ55_04965 [Treponema sp.]|jgi:hypothetical protein|nr:hypothetical protein [Treponema sp.]